MLIFLKLAIRNVWRNRRRSIITLLAIGMGLTLVISLTGLFSGMGEKTVESLIKMQSGHFQIHAEGYTEKSRLLPLDISIENPEKIADEIASIPEITGIAQRLRFGGLVSSGMNSFGILGIGIDPEAEERISIIMEKISEGAKLDDKDGYALIGKKLAEDLDLKVGSMLIIVSNTIYGAMNAIELEVKGLIDTGRPQYDASAVFMTVKDAQRLLDMENRVTDLVISIEDTNKTDAALPYIQRKLSNHKLEINSWKEVGESMWKSQRLWERFSNIINIAVILVAVMGVMNTMLMSVTERTREIGTMMAMGTTHREVVGLFLSEGFVLGIMGGLLGVVLGGIAVQYFATFGISLRGSASTSLADMVGDTVYARFSWAEIIISFLAAQIIAVFSASYPAYIASKQEPVEALRHV